MQQQGVLETGDLEEALNAAQAIGDDRLQQQSQGASSTRQFHSWYFSATLQLV